MRPKAKTPVKRPTGVSTTVADRVAALETKWWPLRRKKLLLIRPRKPGDTYTEVGSNVWADAVRQKAINEGWSVTDLSGNDASRENIENAIDTIHPNLIIHYDHGSTFTLWGQDNDQLEAGLDDQNVDKAAGRIISTVSCLSASGLGPTAISDGIIAYMGYTDLHYFVLGWENEFGQAANAANFALLECHTMQEAFAAGYAAYDQLYAFLVAQGDEFSAPFALHDRDCFALLGNSAATPCPFFLPHCSGGLPIPPRCHVGMPFPPRCHSGLPLGCPHGLVDQLCLHLPPDIQLHCLPGLPIPPRECRYILQLGQIPICRPGLAVPTPCLRAPIQDCDALALLGPCSGMPLICKTAPDVSCQAGPPYRIREFDEDFPHDIAVIDLDKIPKDMAKAITQMIDRMKREEKA